jgi:hypothetical protein
VGEERHKMFADDIKLWTKIARLEDSSQLQEDINRLVEWSKESLLGFNVAKCKVMHVGHFHDTNYQMVEDNTVRKLTATTEEKDLGVIITSNLKPSVQCTKSASKAQSILGMIKRNFKALKKEDFLILYKSYVRPHLEYNVQAWSPYLQKDIKCLENVQRRATRLVTGLKKMTYEERLKRLGLTTLEQRRLRGDLLEAYKILTNKENVNKDNFFEQNSSGYGLRGHSLKLYVPRSSTTIRQNFFSVRVVKNWNNLPQHVVDAPSVN